MKKILFYDCEIANCIPDRFGMEDEQYKYCKGWSDYEGMGIACIGFYTNSHDLLGESSYDYCLGNELDRFQYIADEADEIIGFNSIHFDDQLLKANGVKVTTTYDLLCETRVAAGMPPRYMKGVTRGGYSLEQLAKANLGRGKSGSGELAPKLWQDGKTKEVIQYCLDDVKLLFELWEKRSCLVDPTTGEILFLRGGNRLKWLGAASKHWIKKRKGDLGRAWKESEWRVFFWAIVHSDVSQCRIRITTKINNAFQINSSGMVLQIAFPQLSVDLTDKIVSEFEEATGEYCKFSHFF